MDSNVRTMELLGIDFWDRPVYKCIENGHLWKDITLGNENPELYSCGNEFDGEPNRPIKSDLEIRFKTKYEESPQKFTYQMLGRLMSDCEYYLGYGNRCKDRLYYKDEKEQIEKMKELYNILNEKPVWLTFEQIIKYEELMLKELNN